MTDFNGENITEKIDIFLIDRNKFFRQGVRTAMAQYPDIGIVGESDIDPQAFDQVQAILPQMVLIDINPPSLSGIELTRRIAQSLPGTAVILLTSYSSDEELVQATVAGAAAYLNKDIEASELANCIRRIARGELLLTHSLLARPPALERALKNFQDLWLKGRVVDSTNGPITEREAEVLSYAACGYGNKQIAHALGISEQTIKNHMTSIMSKLGASDRTHAVVMAMQSGWISTSPKAKWDISPLL